MRRVVRRWRPDSMPSEEPLRAQAPSCPADSEPRAEAQAGPDRGQISALTFHHARILLQAAVTAWSEARNHEAVRITWRFTVEDAPHLDPPLPHP